MTEIWVIQVARYGSYLFEGTEYEAEKERVHKARWERAIAKKRLADDSEIESNKASECWNHPNYQHAKDGIRFSCECGRCPDIAAT